MVEPLSAFFTGVMTGIGSKLAEDMYDSAKEMLYYPSSKSNITFVKKDGEYKVVYGVFSKYNKPK